MPGTDVFEEAVLWFAARARAQMATDQPALITYDMAVSVYNFLYSLVTHLKFLPQLVEEFVLVRAPALFYDRIQLIVSHLGHDGFTPYEVEHTLGHHYQYDRQGRPVRLPLPI